jgi:hypothetical protein
MGTGDSLPTVKRTRFTADDFLLVPRLKMHGATPPPPPTFLHGAVLSHHGKFCIHFLLSSIQTCTSYDERQNIHSNNEKITAEVFKLGKTL